MPQSEQYLQRNVSQRRLQHGQAINSNFHLSIEKFLKKVYPLIKLFGSTSLTVQELPKVTVETGKVPIVFSGVKSTDDRAGTVFCWVGGHEWQTLRFRS